MAKNKEEKTNVMRVLEQKKIAYTAHSYPHEEGVAVDGVTVAAGNGKLMEELGVAWHACHSVGTIVHIAVNGEYAGHIVISDVEKPHSRDAIAALKAAGVTKTVMLTGDIQKVADYVARDLGVDEVLSLIHI
mgnify:FL=1